MSQESPSERYISYAQNFEDVMLWRALKHVTNGFYIDVGAQHPVIDSVSKAFYEHGWRGIHVEPTPGYASLLRQDRPDETLLQVALADRHGTLKFFEIPETGLSTADTDIANGHQKRGFEIREVIVPCITLADVFALAGDQDIHWLKIDVEGWERDVLKGWGQSEARPWLVVIESTLPLTEIDTHESWDTLLLDRGYSEIYFDGLNRFYVSELHPEVIPAFRVAPNVFDNFELNGTANSTFCSLINARFKAEEGKLRQEIEHLNFAQLESQANCKLLKQQLTERSAENLRLTQELANQGHALTERENGLRHDFLEREVALIQQINEGRTDLNRIEIQKIRLEKELANDISQVLQELKEILRQLAQCEPQMAEQPLTNHQRSEQEKREFFSKNAQIEQTSGKKRGPRKKSHEIIKPMP